VAVVDEAGATLGEISMLLSSSSTADVVARDQVELAVITDPEMLFSEHPALALFVARQLAERLARVTDYLADLKDEFGDTDGRLGMVPEIVSELLTWRRLTAEAAADAEAEERSA
jgi:CRP-like cAMP-binding protein